MRIIRFNTHPKLAKIALLGAALATAALRQAALAQATDSVTDPATKVPDVSYKSVFKETSLGVEKDTDNWRKANDEVGKFTRGHLDILKWEEQESTKADKASMEKPAEKTMQKPMVEPDAMKKPAMAAKPEPTKPAAAPVHKH